MPTQKADWKIFFNSRWFLIFAIILTLFSFFAFFRAFYYDYKIEREIDNLKEEADKLETKKIEMMEMLDYAQSENFVKEKARLELNMVEPGEKMMIIPNDDSALEISQKDVVELNEQSNFKKWWNYFFNNN